MRWIRVDERERELDGGGGGEWVKGGGVRGEEGELVVTALASVATAGTHGGIQYFTLN